MSYGGLEIEFAKRMQKHASVLKTLAALGALGGTGYLGYQMGQSSVDRDRSQDALLGAGAGALGTYAFANMGSSPYSTGAPTQEYTYEEFDDIFK